LDEIVAKALEKERDRRFSSAGAMREALVAYVNESGERAGPDEVGRLMGELFAKKRERVNKVIQEYVRNPPTPTAIPEALVSGKYALRGTGSVSVERSIASDQGSKLSALVRRTLPRRRGVLVTTLVVPVAVVLGVVAWRSWETRKSALSPAPSAAAVAPPPPASSSSMGPSATSPATGEQGVGAATSGASTEPAVSSPGAPSPAVRAWWGGRRIPSHESSQAPARASASEPAQEATPTVASAPAPPAVASTPPPPAVSSTAAPRGRVYRTDL
jgi:hypothetical protein